MKCMNGVFHLSAFSYVFFYFFYFFFLAYSFVLVLLLLLFSFTTKQAVYSYGALQCNALRPRQSIFMRFPIYLKIIDNVCVCATTHNCYVNTVLKSINCLMGCFMNCYQTKPTPYHTTSNFSRFYRCHFFRFK